MTSMKLLVGTLVATVVAADVLKLKVHKKIIVTEDLTEKLMTRVVKGGVEYESFCDVPGESELANACFATNPFEISDCESLQLFSGYFLGCVESQCGTQCEVVPNQYQLSLEKIEKIFADEGLFCDLGTACTIIDLATGGTFFPTPPPTQAPGGALCTPQQQPLAHACIEEVTGFPEASNCEELDYVIAAYVKCFGLHCGQNCTRVGAFLATPVRIIAAMFGCETTGDSCQLTVSPTKSPSFPVITPAPTIVDIPLTQFPTSAPVAAPTPLSTSAPLVSPTFGELPSGSDLVLVAVVSIVGLIIVAVVLATALVIVVSMMKKQAVAETEVKASCQL